MPNRRNYSANFKTKVAIAAIGGHKAVAQLCAIVFSGVNAARQT